MKRKGKLTKAQRKQLQREFPLKIGDTQRDEFSQAFESRLVGTLGHRWQARPQGSSRKASQRSRRAALRSVRAAYFQTGAEGHSRAVLSAVIPFGAKAEGWRTRY